MRRSGVLPPPSPRLLDEEVAAAYLGISKSRFRTRWTARALPQPHRDGRRLLWDRKLLDSYVDALSAIDESDGGWAL